MRTAISLVMVMVFASTALAESPVVFSQVPYDSAAGSWNSNTPTNPYSTQKAADDFTLTETYVIDQFDFWNVFLSSPNIPETEDFYLRIYSHDPDNGDCWPWGGPDEILYEQQLTSSTLVNTGEQNRFGADIYSGKLVLDPPFTATAGERYWICPMGSNDDVKWSWQLHDEDAYRGCRLSVYLGWPFWAYHGDLTFQLHGTLVPEPASLALFVLGGLALLRRR